MAKDVKGMVSVLDREVLADAAVALGGAWSPAEEPDGERRARLVSCAQLVLYGARRGLLLTATADARASISGAAWVLAVVEELEAIGGGPSDADVAGLAGIYEDDTLPTESARQLARSVLDERVRCLVAHAKGTLRHSRDGDLPARLLLLEPEAAVDQLDLAPGELPDELPPALDGVEPWWLPT